MWHRIHEALGSMPNTEKNSFVIKTVKKLGVQGKYLNIIKVI
jgi:hypothetical protein